MTANYLFYYLRDSYSFCLWCLHLWVGSRLAVTGNFRSDIQGGPKKWYLSYNVKTRRRWQLTN